MELERNEGKHSYMKTSRDVRRGHRRTPKSQDSRDIACVQRIQQSLDPLRFRLQVRQDDTVSLGHQAKDPRDEATKMTDMFVVTHSVKQILRLDKNDSLPDKLRAEKRVQRL